MAAVLHEAPRTFIWDQAEFVRTALHAADRLGEDPDPTGDGRRAVGGYDLGSSIRHAW